MTTYFETRKGGKLQVNGDQMSGDTFAVKDYIKAHLDGKWNGASKTWTIDTDKLQHALTIANTIGLHIDTNPQPAKTQARSINGLCPRCHTYCYGDCTAND